MCATLTDEDVGKLVERADGKVIGSVASVEGGRAQVEPEPDALDSILSRFGWAETFDPFVLDGSDIDEITENRILLGEEFSGGAERSSASDDRDRTGEGTRNPQNRPDR